MKALLLFALLLVGCSDPDQYYTVVINDVKKTPSPGVYWIYYTDPISEPPFPEGFFLDDSVKYVVGDTVILNR